jgi:hypothetical protein
MAAKVLLDGILENLNIKLNTYQLLLGATNRTQSDFQQQDLENGTILLLGMPIYIQFM